MLKLVPYDRRAAVQYAHTWAYGRNPAFYDYEKIGGDCTNFASQCVYAGSGVMNYTPTYGWYYINANNKAPAWTGVTYFHQFMTRKERTPGPIAEEVKMAQIRPGDVVQLSFDGERYTHSPVVVRIMGGRGGPQELEDILVAAHSYDADDRPLSTYDMKAIRFLHFLGTWRIV